MNKKTVILFVMISMLLMACSSKDNQYSNPGSSEKNAGTHAFAVSNSKTTEILTNSTNVTENTTLDINILNNNKLTINTAKIQSIAVRDGNTGETVLKVTDKDNITKISEDLSAVEFTEHEAVDADGWRYELIINGEEEIHIVISGNSQLYICTEDVSQKMDCETDFDLLGYIENML